MIDFTQFGLPVNFLLFAVAAVVVWSVGSRLAYYADAISRATGIGQATIGIVLLAGVTSLPEIGVTATASLDGNAALAVNNLFGSIALQVALLAIVDVFIGKDALTAVVPEPTVLLQGSLNVILISAAAAAMVVGDVNVLGVGLWSWGALLAYLACVRILSRAEGRKPWLAAEDGHVAHGLIEVQEEKTAAGRKSAPDLRSLLWRTAAAAAAILVAGYVLAETGEAIAQQSGLGSSFVGFVLVALATSLPELSTAVSAARRGLFTMAISDILGTNLINVALIFLVDLLDQGEPVIGRLGSFPVFGALLAVVLTALFQAGLAERKDKSILRMGYDSLLVLIVYTGGVVLLYTLRDGGS
ncbi:sodium:calcium antiporter [Nitratireductor sp. ZSWI3]|uniref:sodium:calcium antiporter n=1 Tax=Nitratireductor sp. ZSWI3 TaxID=2966359 RepID=UPI00214F97F2|nr:sodium:calcium antiporter [Nitratireductor sp. ZSWI3]MCR4264675.1 sodium:calcium antiporter [Nitratireductor sp. ZSWI3]